jgi:branched-chain amino acid transport system ATP-binding protein
MAAPVRERRSLGSFLNEMRPSVATGGLPVKPLIVLMILNAADELDRTAFGVLTPEIRDWFGVDLAAVIALTQVATLLTILAAVPMGYFADRLPRTKLTAIGALVWGVATCLTGLAPTILVLGALRFLSGVGKTMDPAHRSLLADYYPPKVRGSVFAFHALGNPLGLFLAPIIAGLVAQLTGYWQLPFFLFAIPSVVFGLLAFRLREPVRGEQERREQGASEEVALTAERPPSWNESFRIAWNVRTLRRIWYGLPFIVGSVSVIVPLMSELLDKKFGLGPGARGLIAGIEQPAALVGIFVGGAYTNRLLRFRPGRVMTYLGILVAAGALSFALIAFIPKPLLPLAVLLSIVRTFCFAVLAPATFAVMSLVVPPRVRGFANAFGSVFVAAGIIPALIGGGWIADAWGVSAGMVAMSAIFVLGAVIWTTASGGVEPDIRQAMAAAMAAQATREAKDEGAAKLLVCRDLDVHYGQVQILFHVDFDVEEGEIVALLGTNGAGKSTLLRAVSGLTPPSNGAIFCDGEEITHLPAHEHSGRGIVMVSGGKGVFPTLTVAENLRLAAWKHREDDAYVKEATDRVMDRFPILRTRYNELAGNLSGGEQQMVALSQAFLSRPRLLMIDELSLGLAPVIVEQLLEMVGAIHAQGTTIILVEQSVNVALTVAERAVFMEKGEVRFTGPTAELLQRNDILQSVFLKGAGSVGGIGSGRGPVRSSAAKRPVDEKAEVLLEVDQVTKAFGGVQAMNGVSLTLEAGTILGLIGPNGAGKTTLFDLVSGFLIPDSGRVTFLGQDITTLTPDARAKLGLQRSFQDARLFPSLTVAENIAVAFERHLDVRSSTMAALHLPNVRRSEAKVLRRVERLIEMFGLGDYRDKFVRELSTGSRRIVDLACTLAADPKVLLLDEPSSGVAQRETEELGPLLTRIRFETGCSILLIEHDMPLITSVSDELLALDLGTVVTRGLPDDVVEHPKVVESYLGTTEEVINRSGALTAGPNTRNH